MKYPRYNTSKKQLKIRTSCLLCGCKKVGMLDHIKSKHFKKWVAFSKYMKIKTKKSNYLNKVNSTKQELVGVVELN